MAFELFSTEDESLLQALNAADGSETRQIIALKTYPYHGGFPIEDYAGVVEAARSAGAEILPADLGPAQLKSIMHGACFSEIFEESTMTRLGLHAPLPETLRTILVEGIRESHCGYAPEKLLAPMLCVQQARNALMADSLLRTGRTGSHVLVAGAEHNRNDVGAPYYLRLRNSGRAVSVAFTEVAEQEFDPQRYASEGDTPKYDLIWFTPRAELGDVCERFRQQLQKLHKK